MPDMAVELRFYITDMQQLEAFVGVRIHRRAKLSLDWTYNFHDAGTVKVDTRRDPHPSGHNPCTVAEAPDAFAFLLQSSVMKSKTFLSAERLRPRAVLL